MNKVIISGRLTRDPEIRYSTNGDQQNAVARFVIAVDRRQARQEGQNNADFPQVVAFGRSAEFAEKYLKQGIKINVIGRLQTGAYTDREGRRVYTTDVIAEELEFAESKNASSGSSQGSFAGSFKDNEKQPAADADGFMDIPDGVDNGLPFD